jgi:tuftelin-interacting protein 11
VLKSKISAVYPDIRRKIGQGLISWNPLTMDDRLGNVKSNSFAVSIIKPWVGIFDSNSMENLLLRTIVPKLVTALRENFAINPKDQNIEIFQCVLSWNTLLPKVHMVCILCGEFFPKWLRVLASWLGSSAPDFGEISEWYTGWKSMFSDTGLESHDDIMGCFNFALEMMQSCLSHETTNSSWTISVEFEKILHNMERNSYTKLIDRKKVEVRAQQTKESILKSNNNSVSFKEVVEIFAQKNNITFVPKIGKLKEGKQIYQFGSCLCYIEHNVVFAQGINNHIIADNKWTPIDLDDLLVLGK